MAGHGVGHGVKANVGADTVMKRKLFLLEVDIERLP